MAASAAGSIVGAGRRRVRGRARRPARILRVAGVVHRARGSVSARVLAARASGQRQDDAGAGGGRRAESFGRGAEPEQPVAERRRAAEPGRRLASGHGAVDRGRRLRVQDRADDQRPDGGDAQRPAQRAGRGQFARGSDLVPDHEPSRAAGRGAGASGAGGQEDRAGQRDAKPGEAAVRLVLPGLRPDRRPDRRFGRAVRVPGRRGQGLHGGRARASAPPSRRRPRRPRTRSISATSAPASSTNGEPSAALAETSA